MKTRISGSFLGLGAFTLLVAPHLVGVACAQETLGGLGAASSIGAGLGAAAAGSAIKRPNMPRGAGDANALIDEAGNGGGTTTTTTVTTAAVAPVNTAPEPQLYGVQPRREVAQLRKTSTLAAPKGGLPRQRETKAARQRRLARLSPAARKREVQRKYKIAPRGWLSRYLPQDRYKFAKDWLYVSTEDTKYYFKPQGLALMKFNPNRVIGFRTWQDAMLAGYKPDPRTKPEPAPKLIQLASQTRGENYFRYVGYVYAGQVSPSSLDATYKYSQYVAAQLKKHPIAKTRVSSTLDAILGATVTGDPSALPVSVGDTIILVSTKANTTGAAGVDANGSPQFPGMPNADQGANGAAMGAPSTGGDSRVEEFNRFSNNAGKMANVPANR